MIVPKKYASAAILVSMLMSWNFGTAAADESKKSGIVSIDVYPAFPPGAQQSFTIHCESKDNDLGSHVIAPPGRYHFTFDPNFFGITLYHCRVLWTTRAVSFEIYNYKRDQGKRGLWDFVWRVSQDGVHGFRDGATNPDLNFPWTT